MPSKDEDDYDISFTGSVTPKATSFLKSAEIAMDFSGKLTLDGTDGGNIKLIQKEFQSAMKSLIDKQAKFLDDWLKDKDAVIADMMKDFDKVKTAGFPDTVALAKAREKTMADLAEQVRKINKLGDEYAAMVSDWASNCRDQQALIAMQQATKAARVKSFNDKAFKVRGALAVRGVLTLATAVLDVTMIILSAGTMAPVFVGLAASGVALGGVTSIVSFAKDIKDNINIEQRVLDNVKKDVAVIQAAFDEAKGKQSDIAKHVTELTNLMKIRDDRMSEMRAKTQKLKVEAASYAADIAKLRNEPVVDAAVIAKKAKAANEIDDQLATLDKQINKMIGENAKGTMTLKGLTDLGVTLGNLTGETPRSVADNLKEHAKNLDSWLVVSDLVGGFVNSVGYVG